MLGAWCRLPGALAATDAGTPVRLAISESVMGDVNLNDARAAMNIWLKQIAQDLNIAFDLKLIDTSAILEGVRSGQLDALGLSVIEYRPIADLLDSSRIVTSAGAEGLEQYLVVVKQNSGIRQLGDLKGRRMCVLKTPKMCLEPPGSLASSARGITARPNSSLVRS